MSMHELSIAQSIIEIVEDNIKNQTDPNVKSVFMKVGKMSNVVVDSLIFGFNTLVSGTKLEGANLVIEEIPIKIKCANCKEESELKNYNFICGNCKGTNVKMISGNELTVSEIELD